MTKKCSLDTRLCAAVAGAVLLLAGCASSKHQAPVEDRTGNARATAPAAVAVIPPPADPNKPADPPKPGAENAGKAGYYTVKQGDTLIRVGLENGQNWKDLVKWNNLDNPNVIEVGQVLRVMPPGTEPNGLGTKPVTTAKVETRPLGAASPASGAASSVPATAAASAPATSATREGDDDINWIWPANGPVANSFDDTRSKGLAITGKAGDPVLAAADGRVVYAGSGLRGYGNLVILKHNNTYLTAYAHNQTLLVKEDQAVRRGQKIAEMGSTDADRVQLHFEIRKLGKPVDPAKLLPPR
ncbi:MAG TPA: peptidoglycan DD-metalloendopeptidase family protein [Albitalea sp.]|uniref:peptidoglycan DD-metalloendopeptidase family protein n=1 Tax=Piscinibacter sp. TaxID=1903157 RepID=UPI002ED1D204